MINQIKTKAYNFLRLSEKWTKTDMIYLAKGGFWLTLSNFSGTILSLILAIAYANLLPKETYGIYKYILSLGALIGIASLPGIDNSLLRSVAMGCEGSLKDAIKAKLKWGMLGALAGLAASTYYFYKNNALLGTGLAIASIFIPLTNSLIFGSYLKGKKLFKDAAIYSVVSQIFIAAFIILALFISPALAALILAYYLSTFAIRLVQFILVYKKNRPNDKKDKETISYGKHLSLMNVLVMSAQQMDKIIIWHLLGPVNLAVYSFATIPADKIKSFLDPAIDLALPKLAGQDENTLKKSLTAKVLKFIALLSIPVALYFMFSQFIFSLVFPEYMSSVGYSKLYALSLFFYPLNMYNLSLTAKAKKKQLYLLRTVSPILKIILFAVLIPLFAIPGAILALIFSNFLNGLFSYYLFKKALK